MPWKEVTTVSLRLDFIKLALTKDTNFSQLCRKFGISRKTGYKWLHRYLEEGPAGLRDRSRRPHTSPNRTPETVEQRVLSLRDKHPAWGGRKIHKRLEVLGMDNVPPPSTITEILHRHGRIDPQESIKHRPWQRFEAEAPNQLWQMDFKGHFPLINGERCHPLSVLDDHSRFCLGLQACGNERRETVQCRLTAIFRRYGMPEQLLVDNGPPWGTESKGRLTRLGVWLVRLGVALVHTRSYHPQTIGKEERFHRTLVDEVLRHRALRDLDHAQRCFDPWRDIYNHERPHEAIGMAVPSSRYRESLRAFPETLPPIVYKSGAIVRKVGQNGRISFRNRLFRVGKALHGHSVELRPAETDGLFDVYFSNTKVSQINLRDDPGL
jgi:transposase InsO family protein